MMIIGLLYGQGCLLEKLKCTRNFEKAGISKSNVYSKMNLYNLVKNYFHLLNSTWSAN